MNLTTILGSLGAIAIVLLLVRVLGFGGQHLAADDAERFSEEMIAGFTAIDAATCKDRQSALVLGADGRIVLLKRTGGRYATRALSTPIRCEMPEPGMLVIDSAERFFGKVTICIDDAGLWQRRLCGTEATGAEHPA